MPVGVRVRHEAHRMPGAINPGEVDLDGFDADLAVILDTVEVHILENSARDAGGSGRRWWAGVEVIESGLTGVAADLVLIAVVIHDVEAVSVTGKQHTRGLQI